MRINYNASAMRANNSLNVADQRVSKALGRISSGLKITAVKDNPSGYAIARRMNAQIEGLSIASKDANNGISAIETAEGALTEIHDMLQRMNELAVKGANGTLTTDDRATLQKELMQLQDEVTRIASDTEFNGQPLLDGSFELKGYTNDLDAKVDYYSDDVLNRVYTIDELEVFYNEDGTIDLDKTADEFKAGEGFPKGVKISSVGNDKVTIKGDQGFEMTVKVTPPDSLPGTSTYTDLKLDVTGIGAMDTQVGANEGQQLAIRIPTISLDRLGIDRTEFTTQESCRKGIGEVKNAILYVSDVRSRLGAYQNRLEHTISSLDITSENMTASYSRIMDADVAEEMIDYTTQQVVSQAATSMLAQANERPSQVLQLLQ